MPLDVIESLNKKELRLALKTRYISDAEQRAVKLSQAVPLYMEETRSMNLIGQQMKDLLNEYIQSELAAEEGFYLPFPL